MKKIKLFFQKAGGVELIKRLLRNHILCYTVFMFLVLPKSRFGFEILSQCIENKILKKLKRKYKSIIEQSNYKLQQKNNKIIWFCWLQGIDNAPELVKLNLEKIRIYYDDYKIVVITQDNFTEYTDIPSFIIEKWKKGIITHTHFSDILRTYLLVKNGGIWIDSTVYATSKIPKEIEESPLFLFRSLKPGSIGKCSTISSWYIHSSEKHPVLLLVQDLLYEYWKTNNHLCDYFLFHLFVEIGLQKYSELVANMPKYSNDTPHILQYEPLDSNQLDEIKKYCFVHKLSYKKEISISKLQ